MAKQDAVGIDLGTTNSAVAWIDEKGHTEMIHNAEGEILTPSVVWFDAGETIVGKAARGAAAVEPGEVARWVKRDMGSVVFHCPIHGRYFPPEVIQACVLRKLREDLAEELPGELGVVITVPAYFDEPRRKATADAGEMAGLDVLDIINEPTAAALAFGERLGYLSDAGGAREPITVLVYDLGGGTFDVTLLRLAPGDIRTLATDGDVQLGGYDWDLRLVDHAAEAFVESGGPDPRQDPVALARLYDAVEEAKHTLSARSRAAIHFEHQGHAARIDIARHDFHERTADLLERTSYTTRQVLAAAALQWSDVDRVLLVGGSTRMPMVGQMLHELTGIEADRTVNPDEAVARGAALYAGHLLRQRAAEPAGDDFQITNVNSHSLGIEGIDPATLRKTNVTLIARNTPLPATVTERFTTKRADQASIVVQVLEGESARPEDCTVIGRTVIRDLPPGLPQGSPVEVRFSYASNGRLEVHATVSGTGREVTLRIERAGGLTDERIAQWKAPVAAAGGFDDFVMGVLMGDSEPGGQPDSPQPTSTLPAADRGRESDEGSTVERAATTAAPPSEPAAAPLPPLPRAEPAGGPSSSPSTGAERHAPPVRDGDMVRPIPSGGRPSRWRPMVFLVGYLVSAVVGLGLGYLLVRWLFPDSGLPQLW